MNYLVRHWRGELPLWAAYWVNNGLLLLPVGFAVGVAMAWIAAWGQGLQALASATLFGVFVYVVVSIWAPVGAWRSATVYVNEGGSGLWGGLAKLTLGIGMLLNGASLVFQVLPEVPAQIRMALGTDPIGKLDIALAPDGRSVMLSGPFGAGAANRFTRITRDAKNLRTVVLDSPGGRLYEASEIAHAVKSRGLLTRATGDCASACTLVFIAGAQRSLMPPARLGFHRASAPSMSPLHDQIANRKLAALYGEAGLPQHFVDQVLRTPSWSIWFPPVAELMDAGILAPPSLKVVPDDGMAADAPAERWRDLLADNPLWSELERRHEGVLARAAARMHEARLRGAEPGAVGDEGLAVALAEVPVVLRSAGARSLEAYFDSLASELRARRSGGDAACLAVLGGRDAAAPERLAAWLQATLLEEADPQPARALSPIELEVLQRELGPAAPERIAALVPGGARKPAAAGCARTLETLDALARLRPPQRQLVVRQMLASAG